MARPKTYKTEADRKVATKAAHKRYRQSEKGREMKRTSDERYRRTQKGKATRKRYEQSEKGKTVIRQYQQSEECKATARQRRQSEKGKLYLRNYQLIQQYGITVDDFDRMFTEQEGRCAICGKHQSECPQSLAVDHDHETKEVRGLLCNQCNAGIGLMQDDPELLRKAIAHLENRRVD